MPCYSVSVPGSTAGLSALATCGVIDSLASEFAPGINWEIVAAFFLLGFLAGIVLGVALVVTRKRARRQL